MKRAAHAPFLLATFLGATLASAGVASLGGCAENLFTSSDPYSKSRIDRYYDRDSAIETSESRKQGNPMGLGSPTGAAYQ